MHRLRLIERSRSLYRSKLFCTRQVGERKSSRGLLVSRKASSLVKSNRVSNCNGYRDKSFTRTLLNPGPNRDSFNPCTFLQVQSKTHVHNQNRLSQIKSVYHNRGKHRNFIQSSLVVSPSGTLFQNPSQALASRRSKGPGVMHWCPTYMTLAFIHFLKSNNKYRLV